jgi:hypothetical protein
LRIRPPNPADAVRINLPIPEVTPRVIESMAPQVVAPMAMMPLTEAVVASNIPDSVVADLMPTALEAASALPEAVVTPHTQSVVSGPLEAVAAAEAEPSRPEPIDPIIDPISLIPEPVISSLIEPPVLPSERVPTAPVVVAQPDSEPAAAPEAIVPAPEMSFDLLPQPLPEPVREEPAVTAAPAEPRRIFVAPTPEAVAPVVPVLPVLPPQPLPEPVREEAPLAVALSAAEPALFPARPPRLAEAIAAAPPAPLVLPSLLPEPAPVVQPVLAMLSQPELAAPAMPLLAPIVNIPEPAPALPVAAPGDAVASAPETARLKDVLASLSGPASPVAPAPEPPKPIAPPAATVPAARPIAPPAGLQTSARADAPRRTVPVGLKSDWSAAVPASTDMRISNGTGRGLMASRFAGYFRGHGVIVSKVANANSFDYRRTVLFYNPDQRAHAEALAAALPFPVRLAEAKQGHGQIELVLGFDLVSVDDELRSA